MLRRQVHPTIDPPVDTRELTTVESKDGVVGVRADPNLSAGRYGEPMNELDALLTEQMAYYHVRAPEYLEHAGVEG
jgi:hypothetical protein